VRLALAAVLFAAPGCGKELNPSFCDAHPADDRCLGAGTDTRSDTPIDQPAGCPADYTTTLAGSSSKYRVVDANEYWPTAELDCRDDGTNTHLIVLNDKTEHQALDPYTAYERHIGYTDTNTEGTWIPITDDPSVYADLVALGAPPWNIGEPNQSISGNCLTMSTDLTMRDRTCDQEPAAYVCECDAYPVNTANF